MRLVPNGNEVFQMREAFVHVASEGDHTVMGHNEVAGKIEAVVIRLIESPEREDQVRAVVSWDVAGQIRVLDIVHSCYIYVAKNGYGTMPLCLDAHREDRNHTAIIDVADVVGDHTYEDANDEHGKRDACDAAIPEAVLHRGVPASRE